MARTKEDNKQEFFVKIDDPVETRRSVLECSKTIVKCMQSHERVKSIRDQKHKHMVELKSLMKETGLLCSKFRKLLPKNKLAPTIAKYKEAHKRMPTSDELEILENELKHIEDKLGDLT